MCQSPVRALQNCPGWSQHPFVIPAFPSELTSTPSIGLEVLFEVRAPYSPVFASTLTHIRMWHESGSKLEDLGRVSFLVRSQIRLSLTDEASKTWLHLERDFLETPYTTIRERQMEVLEKEDGTMNRPGVKLLREKLGKDAEQVMKEQRYVGTTVARSWMMLKVSGLGACFKEHGLTQRH